MDEAKILIERLLAVAGALLEDASAVALIKSERPAAEGIAQLICLNGQVQSLLGGAATVEQLASQAD